MDQTFSNAINNQEGKKEGRKFSQIRSAHLRLHALCR